MRIENQLPSRGAVMSGIGAVSSLAARMSIFRSLALGTAAFAQIWLASPVRSETAKLEPQLIAALRPTRNDIVVAARTGKPDATYRIGDRLTLLVTANADVHLLVLGLGGSGRISVLAPGAADQSVRLFANRPAEIPAPPANYAVRVQGPAGLELIKVIAVTEPLQVAPSVVGAEVHALLRRLTHGYAVADVVIRIVDEPARPISALRE